MAGLATLAWALPVARGSSGGSEWAAAGREAAKVGTGKAITLHAMMSWHCCWILTKDPAWPLQLGNPWGLVARPSASLLPHHRHAAPCVRWACNSYRDTLSGDGETHGRRGVQYPVHGVSTEAAG